MIVVYLLSVQIWTDPPPSIKVMYTKEFPTREECFAEKAKWENKFVSLCLEKIKNKEPSRK